MTFDATVVFLIGEIIGLCLNLPTLIYILKSFDVRVHVFTMILIDAAIANSCCALLIVLDVLLLVTFDVSKESDLLRFGSGCGVHAVQLRRMFCVLGCNRKIRHDKKINQVTWLFLKKSVINSMK
jgi:hypothetical protein